MKRLPYTTTITDADRAAAGARYLDRVLPGWWRHVKIRPLQISSNCNCVLGQLSEVIVRRRFPRTPKNRKTFGYDCAIEALRLGADEAQALGFMRLGDSAYWNLTRAWRDEVRARRKRLIR